jgi:hypothetical protein
MAVPQLVKTQAQKQKNLTSGDKYKAEIISVKDRKIAGVGWALEVTCIINLGNGHTIRHQELLQVWHNNTKAQKLNRKIILPQIAEAIGEPPNRFDNSNREDAFEVMVGKTVGVRAKMNDKSNPPRPTITDWEPWL